MSDLSSSPPSAFSSSQSGTAPVRVESIDLVRAATMILMIFVNDLWSLKDIPAWLEHVERGVDGIGLADVVFPAFLFIVGLSLPFAIDARRRKGDSDAKLVGHVLIRTVALLVMGVWLVNGETYNAAATGMPRPIWNPLVCFSFILIWNAYPATVNRMLTNGLRALGIIILIVLAVIYRGGKEGAIETFAPHWWGILGIIGWAYLVSGLVTIFARGNFYAVLAAWVFFAVLSMVSHAHMIPDFFHFIPGPILGGTPTGLTMGGVLTTMIFLYFRNRNSNKGLTLSLLGFAVILIILSVIVRPYWGLAKLGATPAWLFLCSAFTILGLVAFYWLADVMRKGNWFNIIRPAGAGTLLCYLVPYFSYGALRLFGIHWPEFMLTGGVGLVKSFLFAILCAMITGWLMKLGVRLKL